MPLLPADEAFLDERGHPYQVVEEGGMTCVIFPDLPLPTGLDHSSASLLLRLPAGFPDVPPDMWWIDPGVRKADGAVIQGTEAVEAHVGRRWQRWSRHLQAGQWKSGIDGLESYVALVHRELQRAAA
jgi:hypothetical protein